MTRRNETWALRANRLLLSVCRNWLGIATLVIGIYISLPFVAPILMKAGLPGPADVIYTVYGPFCHQFGFRSFFLFGDQAVYPRANTGTALGSFEDYAIKDPEFVRLFALHAGIAAQDVTRADLDPFTIPLEKAAREFHGDEAMGYKLTLCERDIAIYLAVFVGAILFRFVRRRLRPVPLLIYVILGLGPIGIDGFSQLFGYPPFNFWPLRETLPVFRVVTGILFGLMNVWLGFPYLELSFRETREQIELKLHRAGLDT